MIDLNLIPEKVKERLLKKWNVRKDKRPEEYEVGDTVILTVRDRNSNPEMKRMYGKAVVINNISSKGKGNVIIEFDGDRDCSWEWEDGHFDDFDNERNHYGEDF